MDRVGWGQSLEGVVGVGGYPSHNKPTFFTCLHEYTVFSPTPHIRTMDIDLLVRKAAALYLITKDPLTFSAATVLAGAKDPMTDPQLNALELLQRQIASYETIYTEPLVLD